jgi:hypothetical protein
MLLVRAMRRGGLGSALRLVPWGLAATVPFLLHAAASHAAFDSFLPVSGTVKRLDRLAELRERGIEVGSAAWFLDGAKAAASLVAGNTARFLGGFLPPGPWSRAVVAGAAGVVLLGLLAWRTVRAGWRGIVADLPAEALLLAPAITVQIALYSAVIPGGMQYGQWYWGPGYLLLALTAGALLAPLAPRGAVLPGCAWLGLAAGTLVALPQPVETQTEGLREVLARLGAETRGEPVRVGAWNAGIVAWLAPGNATVVNLDGLVNSTEFARNHAGDRDRRGFVRDAGIRYLADYALGAEEDAWRRVLEIRLGANPGPVEGVELGLEPLLVTEPVATPAGVPRRYHLLRIHPE